MSVKTLYKKGTTEVINPNIVSENIPAGAVTSAKIASGAVTGDKIGLGAITSTKMASSSVTSSALAENSVIPSKIAPNSITSTKIQDNAVTTSKILNKNVSWGKLKWAGQIPIADVADTTDFENFAQDCNELYLKGYSFYFFDGVRELASVSGVFFSQGVASFYCPFIAQIMRTQTIVIDSAEDLQDFMDHEGQFLYVMGVTE